MVIKSHHVSLPVPVINNPRVQPLLPICMCTHQFSSEHLVSYVLGLQRLLDARLSLFLERRIFIVLVFVFIFQRLEIIWKQESIPVGCVPPAFSDSGGGLPNPPPPVGRPPYRCRPPPPRMQIPPESSPPGLYNR